jgi:hypothetical protein
MFGHSGEIRAKYRPYHSLKIEEIPIRAIMRIFFARIDKEKGETRYAVPAYHLEIA